MNILALHRYFNQAGWPFIGVAAIAVLLSALAGGFVFYLVLILFAWVLYFFRDPPRVTPLKPGLIVSPADGKVVGIHELIPDIDLGIGQEKSIRVSIFLNVFNVHVNRIPAAGIIRVRRYRSGAFVNASLDKASEKNERMALALQLTGDHPADNKMLGVVQIAGLIARRIICLAQESDVVTTGQRYGIIRFGSRVDLYLPAGVQPLVVLGQTMIGGETVIADCTSDESARHGEARL